MPPPISPEKRRQAILNFLIKNGEASCREIGEALGLTKGLVTSFIRDTRACNELATREQRAAFGIQSCANI